MSDDQLNPRPKPRHRRAIITGGVLASGLVAGGITAGTLSASAATTVAAPAVAQAAAPAAAAPAAVNQAAVNQAAAPAAATASAAPATGTATATKAPAKTSTPVRSDEKSVAATLEASLKAKALAAVPGGTVYRIESDAGDGVYEAHMTKADGTRVTVKFDKSGNVTKVEAGMGTGDPAPAGGHAGRPGGAAPGSVNG